MPSEEEMRAEIERLRAETAYLTRPTRGRSSSVPRVPAHSWQAEHPVPAIQHDRPS